MQPRQCHSVQTRRCSLLPQAFLATANPRHWWWMPWAGFAGAAQPQKTYSGQVRVDWLGGGFRSSYRVYFARRVRRAI